MSHAPRPAARTRVWDLPTRLFHWTLAALVLCSVVTIKLGGNWMEWHFRSGYAILALLLFRVLWGFAGSRYARFASFVRGPRAIADYLRGKSGHVAGHNPLGALSVLALLAVLLTQASTGLFSNDGSYTEGPLAKLISGSLSNLLTSIHKAGEFAIYGLVGLHVAAIVYYALARREQLLPAMVTGDRTVDAPPARDDLALRLRALVLLALCAGAVAWLVTR
jgi:cytochrome b